MSATKKQIKANQQNAKKSTGPKTVKGKEIVSQNATTFGLFSNKLIIKSEHLTEDRVDYDLLIEDLRSELQPKSFFQEYLIKKIANCLWRTQRVAIAETAHINKQLAKIDEKIDKEQIIHAFKMKNNSNLQPLDYDSENSQDLTNLVNETAIPDKSFATRILYYEMRLDRQLTRTYELLRRVQHKDEHDRKEQARKNAIPQNKPNSF